MDNAFGMQHVRTDNRKNEQDNDKGKYGVFAYKLFGFRLSSFRHNIP